MVNPHILTFFNFKFYSYTYLVSIMKFVFKFNTYSKKLFNNIFLQQSYLHSSKFVINSVTILFFILIERKKQ
jgi:hypothetical protein